MSIEITSIEEVGLPNYMETIIGTETYERDSPLLAKLKILVKSEPQIDDLIFEIREQGDGSPSIDEYYEDQVFDEVQKLLSQNLNKKQKGRLSNELIGFFQMEAFKFWLGEKSIFPIKYNENI
ncbi:hypothetical protein [Microbulbifer sp. GL-2]|uniref:hypothetical protein n=1 Tax=Microbulbifer sp. GL-2 TaxID=2591606 RepID=UPI00117E7D1B|nr:hypothetical protein [Microbulbifer sp. GL-2]